MSAVDPKEFDAYYKWLAIPPQEQPPNCYRLLGVTLFEDDPEVIAAAADRQMAHVKSFAAGRYVKQSQHLLNQLAQARICLLNVNQKAQYDVRLRNELSAVELEKSFDAHFSEQAVRESPDFTFPSPIASVESRNPARQSALAAPVTSSVKPQINAVPHWRNRKTNASVWRRIRGTILLGVALIPVVITAWNFNPSSAPKKPITRLVAPVVTIPPVEPSRSEPSAVVAPAKVDKPSPQLTTREIPVIQAEQRRRDTLLPLPVAPKQADLIIDVNLSERHQRIPVNHESFRVLRFAGFGIVSEESLPLNESEPAILTLDAVLDVTLRLEVDTRPTGSFIVVSPIVRNGTKEIPFVLATIGRSGRVLRNKHENALRSLAALNAEKQELTLFINAPVAKSLAARGQARTRLLRVNALLPAAELQVKTLQTELTHLERFEELAVEIDKDCKVELEIIAANPFE